jgi:FAD dependent oxidoreductase TIGR03364
LSQECEVAVVGSGIIGLASAYHAARCGRDVVVFERDQRARGASVRNFGMVWPIGQPFGPLRALARRSREVWLDVLAQAGLWHDPVGSLHLAYRDDEAEVLTQYAARSAAEGDACELIGAARVGELAPPVRTTGLTLALWSPAEICVDPREVVGRLPAWLSERFGVRFATGEVVTEAEPPHLRTNLGRWRARRVVVCSGDDLRTLFPAALQSAGLVRCKLQMLRSEPVRPSGRRLGPMLATGLTLRHYGSFAVCPGVEAVRARIARDEPELDSWGIHILLAHNGRDELVIGDSHEYGDEFDPSRRERIDELILEYLARFVDLPGLRISERWTGTYCKHPAAPYVELQPVAGCRALTGLGGAGMTLSFGIAERLIQTLEEESI